jgi:hypothetical protein
MRRSGAVAAARVLSLRTRWKLLVSSLLWLLYPTGKAPSCSSFWAAKWKIHRGSVDMAGTDMPLTLPETILRLSSPCSVLQWAVSNHVRGGGQEIRSEDRNSLKYDVSLTFSSCFLMFVYITYVRRYCDREGGRWRDVDGFARSEPPWIGKSCFYNASHTWELAPALEHRAEFPQFLHQGQSLGLLGRVISSSQGLCLYTNTEKHTHIYRH